MIWYLCLWLICGVVAASRYRVLDRSAFGGFALGALLGPLGVLIAYLTPLRGRTCPRCQETIRRSATTCRYCGQVQVAWPR